MKKAWKNGVILDGTREMTPRKGEIILTEGEKITGIVPDGTDLTGYEIIDLGGKYIMPGLINLHVHLPATGKPSNKKKDPAKTVKLLTSNALFRRIVQKMCEGYAKTELMSGVTTIRTVGGVMSYDSIIRDRIAKGEIDGPRILAGNMAVSVPGGHMAGSLAYEATTPEEAGNYVAKIAEDHPDLIRLMITGGVLDARVKGEPGEMKMTEAEIKAACDEAHKRGLQVAAHVESPEGVRAALKNGVDTIEHGALPDEEILQLFEERKAAHVATLSPALPYALFDREISHASEIEQYNGEVVFNGVIECAKKCLERGIPVGIGTDTGCPYITHYDMWRELNYFHKYCDVSNAFALYTATLGNAAVIKMDQEIGSIEPGKCADFVVTEKNPLEDLQALRNISMVAARGKVYDSPKVKKMPEVEKELDKFI